MDHRDFSLKQISKALSQAEYDLNEIKVELISKSDQFEEVSDALKALLRILKKIENEKTVTQKNFLSNFHLLARPYLEELKGSKLNVRQTAIVNALESSLNEVFSPFAVSLLSGYLSLTPKEIRVANLIKEGYTTKEIAALFCLSEHTIKSHRSNIRRKLKLKNKKINLGSHLRSLPE
jgi:DNA-binding CsgD family transcriptional regulator/DNA-binding transcriptional MerR regulator